MPKFIKKPVEVDAEQFKFGQSLPFQSEKACQYNGERWYVTTIHGDDAPIVDGDWIIREPDGIHFYPCKPDIFEATYEPAEEAAPATV